MLQYATDFSQHPESRQVFIAFSIFKKNYSVTISSYWTSYSIERHLRLPKSLKLENDRKK